LTEIKARRAARCLDARVANQGGNAMLVQIDGNPALSSVWRFEEKVCIPAALFLTLLTAMAIWI
jgi:hypothetical protein